MNENTTDSPSFFLQGIDRDLVHAVEAGEITLRRAKEQQWTRDAGRIYIGAGAGGNITVDGEHGVVTGIHYFGRSEIGAPVAAFVKLDNRPAMLFVEGVFAGDKGEHMTIGEAREIDRDEFDRITTIDVVRRQSGWVI